VNFTRRRAKPFENVRLPLIALVDVVLFLLLYFIIAGTSGGNESQLSSTLATDRRGGGAGGALSSQVLRVEAVGGKIVYQMGSRVMKDRAELVGVVRLLPKEPGIVVKVANEAPVSAAATALQAVRDAGFTKVSYVAGR
jgi:biopolymer transport protein ExbD